MAYDVAGSDIPTDAQRLLQLADLIENLPENGEYDHGWWLSKNGCKTVACAMGWAALVFGERWNLEYTVRCAYRGQVNGDFYVNGKLMGSGVHAGAELFKLTYDDARWLFALQQWRSGQSINGRRIRTPHAWSAATVAKRLRRIAAEKIAGVYQLQDVDAEA